MQNAREIRDKENLVYVLSENREECETSLESMKETVIILYLYYEDTLDNYLPYLENIPDEMKIYVVTANRNVIDLVKEYIYINGSKLNKKNIELVFQTNRGRDVAALTVTCREIILNSRYFCFVHDKRAKSEYLVEDTNRWITNLWNNTLASSAYIKNVLQIFEQNDQIGVLAPPEPLGNYMNAWFNRSWYDTYEAVKNLQRQLKLDADIREEFAPFTVGTVLWGRTSALQKMFQKEWSYNDFVPENEPVGKISYAIERIWAYVAQDAKYKTGTIMTTKYASEQMIFLQSLLENSYWAVNKFLGLNNAHEINGLREKISQIENFYKDNEKIYLYGAGERAKSCLSLLFILNLPVQGIIVTNKSENLDEFEGITTQTIDDIGKNKRYGIIIAVGMKNLDSVKGELEKRDITNYITFV